MSKMLVKSGFLALEMTLLVSAIFLIFAILSHWVAGYARLKQRIGVKANAMMEASNLLENITMNFKAQGIAVQLDDQDVQRGVCLRIEQSDLPNFFWVKLKFPYSQDSSPKRALLDSESGKSLKYIVLKTGLMYYPGLS